MHHRNKKGGSLALASTGERRGLFPCSVAVVKIFQKWKKWSQARKGLSIYAVVSYEEISDYWQPHVARRKPPAKPPAKPSSNMNFFIVPPLMVSPSSLMISCSN